MAELIGPQQRRPSSYSRRMGQPLEYLRSRLKPAAASSWQALRRRSASRATQQEFSSYAPWFRQLCQWSPGVIPPFFGSLLLLICALLATRPIGQRPLIAPNTLLPLFIFFVVGGLVWGYLLYIARGAVSWFGVAVGGAALYLLITAAFVAGWSGLAVMAALLAGAAALYARGHLVIVPAGTLQITTSTAGYSRALLPGVALLLPGERVGQTVQAGERQYECPAQHVEVHDENGAIYVAQAAATVACRVALQRAQRVATQSDWAQHWEDDTHEAICSALHQALAEWGASHLAEEGEPPERLLTRTMLGLLRGWSRDAGVRIEWIKAHDIWLTPASETIPADEWLVGAGDAETTIPSAQAREQRQEQEQMQAPPQEYEAAGLTRTQALPSIDQVELIRRPPETPPPAREALAPEALSDAYDAVREGHILDPATIRDVASAFMAVASDAEMNATFPFDALGAARILLERATSLERASNARTRANSDFLR